MKIFEELSHAINPNESIDQFKKRLARERIRMLEGSIKIHMAIIHDIEKDIETIKTQLHDAPKTHPHPVNTLVDDDDVFTCGIV